MKSIFSLAGTFMFSSSLLCLSSCSEMKEENVMTSATKTSATTIENEEAYPGETGVVKKGQLFGKEISYREINNEAVFESDIILSKEQLNSQGNARTDGTGITFGSKRWPDGIVYYTIDKSMLNQAPVYAAIAEVQSWTSIKFVQRTTQYDYVTFKVGRGFSSELGYGGGQQLITVGLAYTKGSIIHEIGHTLGLFHEHTRADRDQTIKINFANIVPSAVSYFDKYEGWSPFGFDYDTMDLNSIMMMGSYYMSSNGQPSMTRLTGQTFDVQRDYLSNKDFLCIRAMYSNLYAVRYSSLYAADQIEGNQAPLSGIWNTAQALLGDFKTLYAAVGGSLVSIDPLTGNKKIIASNFNNVQAMTLYEGNLYVINDGYLKKVSTYSGVVTTLSSQIWLPATDLVNLDGFLYLMTKNALFRVTPSTGTYYQMLSLTEARELTVMGENLYFVNNNPSIVKGIYRFKPSVGIAFLFEKTPRSNFAQMTAFNGNLYVVDFDNMYQINSEAKQTFISGDWTNTKQLTAIRTLL